MLKLLEIFPEANFIFIVRNPVIVYLSTKKFFGQLFPTVNLEEFTIDDISNMVLEVYVKLMQDYLSDKKRVDSKRIIELRFETLLENPTEEIESLYDKFSFKDFKELKPVFQEYLGTLTSHKKDSYTIGQQELDRVMEHVGFAMKHWNYEMPKNLTIVNS